MSFPATLGCSRRFRCRPQGACRWYFFQVIWHGILPGSCQTIFRAELLAVSCALGSVRRAIVYTDSQSVCRIATGILAQLRDGLSPGLPSDNRDLWAFFLSMARGADLDFVRVRWIKGHVNYRTAVGMDKVHAWFNHWVDLAAKEALGGHFTPLFQHMVKDFRRKLVLANWQRTCFLSRQGGDALCQR